MEHQESPTPRHHEAYPTERDSFPASGVNSLAPVVARWAARLIDALLLGIPFSIVLVIVTVVAAGGDPTAEPIALDDPRAEAWTWGGLALLAVLYETATITRWGQTAGKLAVGIRVARQANGRSPLWWESALRIGLPAVVVAVPHPLAKVAAMGLLAAAMFDPLQRGLHDRAAGTVVVRAR